MSISSIQSNIQRVQKDITYLQQRFSDASSKEAAKSQRIVQIESSITPSTSASIAQSRRKDIARLQGEIASIQKDKAYLSKQIVFKTKDLHRHEAELAKEEERERKKFKDAERRRQQEHDEYLLELSRQLEVQKQQLQQLQANHQTPQVTQAETKAQYDVFISHASEDKEDFVRPLADALIACGLRVWYDEFQLQVGDSLRQSIDRGLANSRYGIVVLSSSFFSKNWPQYELDGMVAKEMNGGKMILPIWHKVTKDEVMRYSPSLADKVALNSSLLSVGEIANKLAEVVCA